MWDGADDDFTTGAGRLRMAAQTEIRVRLREELAIDGAVRCMASGATFTQCLVFEDKAPRLIAMALGALLVFARHAQSASRFHDVKAMRVVALHAIHVAFNHRMVLRQFELGMHFHVATETGLRIASGVNDELAASATRSNVLAAGAMA